MRIHAELSDALFKSFGRRQGRRRLWEDEGVLPVRMAPEFRGDQLSARSVDRQTSSPSSSSAFHAWASHQQWQPSNRGFCSPRNAPSLALRRWAREAMR